MELPSLVWPCTLSELSILLKDCTLELLLMLIFNFGVYHLTKFVFFFFSLQSLLCFPSLYLSAVGKVPAFRHCCEKLLRAQETG